MHRAFPPNSETGREKARSRVKRARVPATTTPLNTTSTCCSRVKYVGEQPKMTRGALKMEISWSEVSNDLYVHRIVCNACAKQSAPHHRASSSGASMRRDSGNPGWPCTSTHRGTASAKPLDAAHPMFLHMYTKYLLVRLWCSQRQLRRQMLHLLLSRWCVQMVPSPHSIYVLHLLADAAAAAVCTVVLPPLFEVPRHCTPEHTRTRVPAPGWRSTSLALALVPRILSCVVSLFGQPCLRASARSRRAPTGSD